MKLQEHQNPFDDASEARHLENWYAGLGLRASRLEKQLLKRLISGFPTAKTVLEVGCGTGHFTRWMNAQGLTVTGLDASAAMLAEAKRLGGASFMKGDAMALPFANSEFDLTALITTLEFVTDPELALAEAVRMAKQGLLLGVLNRHSLLAARRRFGGKPRWKSAHFFSVKELSCLVTRVCGERLECIGWRTTLWPAPLMTSLPLPWGGFIGMAVHLRASL